MKRTRYYISDRAVIRHLELIEGLNISALRRKIRRKVELAQDYPGATGVVSGGFSYKLDDNVVTTIIPACRQPGLRMRRKRRK